MFEIKVIKGCCVGHIKGSTSKWERIRKNKRSSPLVLLANMLPSRWPSFLQQLFIFVFEASPAAITVIKVLPLKGVKTSPSNSMCLLCDICVGCFCFNSIAEVEVLDINSLYGQRFREHLLIFEFRSFLVQFPQVQ